jgi:type IV secretory pathway VirB3-like protein
MLVTLVEMWWLEKSLIKKWSLGTFVPWAIVCYVLCVCKIIFFHVMFLIIPIFLVAILVCIFLLVLKVGLKFTAVKNHTVFTQFWITIINYKSDDSDLNLCWFQTTWNPVPIERKWSETWLSWKDKKTSYSTLEIKLVKM